LKALVNRASSFAPRIAFFVIKGDQSIGWRARGFQGSVGDNAIHQMSFAVAADTAVGEAARSRSPWSGSPSSHSENHMILNRFGDDPPARIVAVPLVVRDRAVAVLYADSNDLDSDAINLEAIETLVRVAGMAVELLVARAAPSPSAAPAEATPPPAPAEAAPAPAPAEPAYTPTVEYDEITPVVEESAPSSPVAEVEASTQWVEPEPAPVVPEPAVFEPAPEPQPVVEAQPEVTADLAPPVEAAPEPVEAPAPAATPRRRYGADAELPVEVSGEEERRLHSDARRFARLLVSEIKLYNEQKVAEGRSEGDLYQRLREYIDRSREMYDKRVKPEVAQRYDYFHNELVRTLAEGDESKLGAAYPGATVSA